MSQEWRWNADRKTQSFEGGKFMLSNDFHTQHPPSGNDDARNSPDLPRSPWRMILTTVAAVILTWTILHCAAGDIIGTLGTQDAVPLEHLWAQYSPFFPVERYDPPPAGCEITQVNILQRHGARYPTTGAAMMIVSAVSKLQDVKEAIMDPKLLFLKDYEYDLGTDDLVPSGAQQSLQAGQVAFSRYAKLISKDTMPFVRASDSLRVVQSATNWTAGISKASNKRFNPVLSVAISEASGANNTLDDNNCPAASGSDAQTSAWINVFAPPITQRLNKGAPGAGLTDQETYALMSLCAFDTVAHALDSKYKGKFSPFCGLFTKEEFEDFEYVGDLDKYYNTGYGNPLGPVQGVGYVNELLARLTSTPVKDSTQVNHTLDSSSDTFPLDRTIYADFSHDNELIPIYATIGLFRQKKALNPEEPDDRRNWRASQLVPFAGRMVVEKMRCEASVQQDYVRILVNDALQPLEFCSRHGPGVGLCTLDAFIESQTYARNNGEGDFEKCFE
ncbi:hypothetical protein V5O48_010515 [Marasmius crinis-equi]|uniref:Phytase A n=1 Tax=Marasmius crinis-equi TaxID=585013 RepID=A0ABR3F854_9AGAR